MDKYSYKKNSYSRKSSIYQHGKTSLQERGRSRSPYFCQETTLSQAPGYSRHEDSLLDRHRSQASLYRRKSQTPYSRLEVSSLDRSRSRTSSHSHQKGMPLNIRDKRYEKERRERSISKDHERNKSRERGREEIVKLHSALSAFVEEVRDLRHEKEKNSRIQRSLSPEPSAARYLDKIRKNLEPMDSTYKKAFRDEVVQILKCLDNSLVIDHTKRWIDIEKNVSQKILPAIERALGNRFQYTDVELKKVLQSLHRHRREAYTTSLNPLKSKIKKQRIGTNSRRKEKKERRQRGFCRMVNPKDQMLVNLQPSMGWNNWIKDLEGVINDSNYHSDEVSESDEEKAQEEKDKKIRPSRNEGSSHVIHVYDKPWRSQRVRKILRHADLIGERIQHMKIERKRWYDDRSYTDDSKPPQNAPKWTISTSYHSG